MDAVAFIELRDLYRPARYVRFAGEAYETELQRRALWLARPVRRPSREAP